MLAWFNGVVWYADLMWDDDAGQPGEQFTMFFQDGSGNSLEFKVRHQLRGFQMLSILWATACPQSHQSSNAALAHTELPSECRR